MSDEVSKAVLITGCSSGIGQATAAHLAERGWNVYATARRAEALADLAERGCKTLSLDVTDEDSMKAAVAAVEEAEGAVGVLINNAARGGSAERRDALRGEALGVDVVIVEPGLIKTRFGETAVASVGATPDSGPYATFNQAVADATAGAYEGPMARLGAGPEAVARKIERAISKRRPRTRYPVTASARLILTMRRLLPDRAWDRFVGSTYPRPGQPAD